MKLSEIRPCDNCGGAISPSFYYLKISLSFVSQRATQEVLGMSQFFGGLHTLQLAEVFAPSSEDAIVIGGEKRTRLMESLVYLPRLRHDERTKPRAIDRKGERT